MVAEPERFNGDTVLLLHDKNFSGAYWEPTVASLVKSGFRVVASKRSRGVIPNLPNGRVIR